MSQTEHSQERDQLSAHVVLCTGYIPPHALAVCQAINRRLKKFTILLSTPMEANRRWRADWGDLDVQVQRTWTFKKSWKHAAGFSDVGELHVPLDTFRRLRQLQPDCIVSEELGFRSLMCGLYRCWDRHRPLVLVCNLSEHTEQGRGAMRLWLRRWLARRSDLTMVNGHSGKRYLESIGFDARRLRMFPYVNQPGLFDHIPLERSATSPPQLVTCGELSQRKGMAGLIMELDAWAGRNPEKSLCCQILGDGPLRRQLSQMPRHANFNLELLGYCDYAEVSSTFTRAGILAFPSLADEWGMVVEEALAAGLPVLGSVYSQAVDELVVESHNGWRFRPDHQAEFRQAVDRALAIEPNQLASMRYNCRQSVAHRTPDWAADQFVDAVAFAIRTASDKRAGQLNL